MKLNHRYINNEQGTPEFIILPIAEYEELLNKAVSYDDDEAWDDIPFEKGDNDDALIPHDVVSIMIDQDLSLLAAWRIYRGLSQQEVAEQMGLTQSAISQMERVESKPQKKTREKLAKIYQCDVAQMY